MPEKFYTPMEIAEQMKVTRLTVYNWIKAGWLSAVKVGNNVRISQSAFEAFLARGEHQTEDNTKGVLQAA